MAKAQTVTIVTHNTFFKDLEEGKRWERLCAQVVRWTTHHKAMDLAPPKSKGWDLLDPETGWTIEVKMDARSRNTRRFLLELEMYGKPSGLMACQAREWVWWDGEALLFFRLEDAKALLELAGRELWLAAPGDRGAKKRCRFVDRDAVYARCPRIYRPVPELLNAF